ncbi:Rhodanese-like domain containing protein [Tritrichomonas foetus]|uniref:protein-tyrosine-phosphatase n=1 Tax=Tritrichomonas foetus TaxID=1144522 RepID=A0A1J4J7H2_9EUKA|nr:Rhodanese-like domain containing protein [Tritrichomonas foetus]|eukprot:OHS93611.1 Rhodanese-like domain containing protein [Tritrichomonas foetus]
MCDIVSISQPSPRWSIPVPDPSGLEVGLDAMPSRDDTHFDKITPSALEKMLTDPSSHNYSNVIIVDARYPYEFMGGRIAGARNINKRSQLLNLFERFRGQNVCIVFHCEFSSERGPKVMQKFRNYDRSVNEYPNLTYPNIFLLEGGFKRFFAEKHENSSICIGNYVPMREKKYVMNGELRRYNALFKQEMIESSLSANVMRRRNSKSCDQFLDQLQDGVFIHLENSIVIDSGFSASQ